jgi:hypothetical protein
MRHVPSPATIIACIALVVSLGGVSYAAGVLPKNSVGSKQLRKAAVKPSKVAPRTIALFKGQRGDPGAKGDSGPQGNPGPQGEAGPPGPFPAVLPSGKTMRGAYSIYSAASGSGSPARDEISFGFALPSPPTGKEHFIPQAGPNDPNCPGTWAAPEADPGHLCVYENVVVGGVSAKIITVHRYGALLAATSNAAGLFGSNGSWAVTGP